MTRLLALVMPGQEAAALAALPALIATARGDRARMRIACMQPLPPPRENEYGQVVADTDREMARITRIMEATFAAATRRFADVPIECVVRFGAPPREARIETEAFAPHVVARFERRPPLGAIRYLLTGARRSRPSAASASAATRATRSAAFWRRAMRVP